MQREILKPQLNRPLTVKLDFGPEGIERDGKFGLQYQYTVNDDQGVMWLELAARAAILKSGAQAGDEIAITKRAKGKWEVARVSDAKEPSAISNQQLAEGCELKAEGFSALPRPTKRAPFPPSSYYQPTPQLDSPLPITNGHGRVNGNGHQPSAISDQPKAAAPAVDTAPAAIHPYEQRYARMFIVAAHALALAHQQLVQEGMDLEPFNWEDIRATAIHFAISFERREERRS